MPSLTVACAPNLLRRVFAVTVRAISFAASGFNLRPLFASNRDRSSSVQRGGAIGFSVGWEFVAKAVLHDVALIVVQIAPRKFVAVFHPLGLRLRVHAVAVQPVVRADEFARQLVAKVSQALDVPVIAALPLERLAKRHGALPSRVVSKAVKYSRRICAVLASVRNLIRW